MVKRGGGVAKRVVLEGLGWLLVVGGIIAMPLPGPGLLILVGGVAQIGRASGRDRVSSYV